jgi:RNA polymerase sigma factor (sigma-70 family)
MPTSAAVKSAFSGFYESRWKSAWSFFYFGTGKHDVSEALAQDLFFRLFRAYGTDGRSPTELIEICGRVWRKSAQNLLYEYHRNLGRARDFAISIDELADRGHRFLDVGPSPEWLAEYAETASCLHSCIRRLSNQQRQCILLQYFVGMSHREIAEKLRISPETVKSHVDAGRERLRRCLNSAPQAIPTEEN